MAGRRPLPTKIHKQRGEPGKRKHAPNLDPAPDIPEPPDSVKASELALEEYRRIAQELLRYKVISQLDRSSLANHALAYALREMLFLKIGKEMQIGDRKPAEFAMIIDCMKLMETTGDKLGLNPAGRSRIHLYMASDSENEELAKQFFE